MRSPVLILSLFGLGIGVLGLMTAGNQGEPTLKRGQWKKSLSPPQLLIYKPGLPLSDAELADYVRGAVWWSNGNPSVPPGFEVLADQAKASLQGGSRGAKIAEGKQVFEALQILLLNRLADRRKLLPPEAMADSGHGPPIYYWNHSTDSLSWNWTSVDWYGRPYAGDNDMFGGFATAIEFAASFVPVYGPWVVAAVEFAKTGEVDAAAKAALIAALPGGPAVQMGADFAIAVAGGQDVDSAAMAAFLNQYPEAKAAYQAVLASYHALQSGDIPQAVNQGFDAYMQAEQTKNSIVKDFF